MIFLVAYCVDLNLFFLQYWTVLMGHQYHKPTYIAEFGVSAGGSSGKQVITLCVLDWGLLI